MVPREDDKTINKISKEIKQFILQKKEKADRFLKLINNNTVCRSIQILNYFEEKNAKLSSFEISNYLSIDEKYILIHLRTLLADDKIAVNHQNKYLLK